MSMETLEFIIYPDGRVKETVTGITGASCQEVTAAIEAQLGRVVSVEKTSEHFAQTVKQSNKETNQVTFSNW
jgi:Holliday junction resolvasome RuvABC endonuclease subunit